MTTFNINSPDGRITIQTKRSVGPKPKKNPNVAFVEQQIVSPPEFPIQLPQKKGFDKQRLQILGSAAVAIAPKWFKARQSTGESFSSIVGALTEESVNKVQRPASRRIHLGGLLSRLRGPNAKQSQSDQPTTGLVNSLPANMNHSTANNIPLSDISFSDQGNAVNPDNCRIIKYKKNNPSPLNNQSQSAEEPERHFDRAGLIKPFQKLINFFNTEPLSRYDASANLRRAAGVNERDLEPIPSIDLSQSSQTLTLPSKKLSQQVPVVPNYEVVSDYTRQPEDWQKRLPKKVKPEYETLLPSYARLKGRLFTVNNKTSNPVADVRSLRRDEESHGPMVELLPETNYPNTYAPQSKPAGRTPLHWLKKGLYQVMPQDVKLVLNRSKVTIMGKPTWYDQALQSVNAVKATPLVRDARLMLWANMGYNTETISQWSGLTPEVVDARINAYRNKLNQH